MLIAVFCLLIPITIDSVKKCKCLTKDLTNGLYRKSQIGFRKLFKEN